MKKFAQTACKLHPQVGASLWPKKFGYLNSPGQNEVLHFWEAVALDWYNVTTET